ncbi:hypothetical protein Tco_0744536 [Tanacetum coccineum]
MTRTVKVIENTLDAEIRIILLENVQNHRKIRTKELLSEALGAITVKKMMRRSKMATVLYALDVLTWSPERINQDSGLLPKHMTRGEPKALLHCTRPTMDDMEIRTRKIGKQDHASHKAKNVVSTTRCLELLRMDLFGPSAVRSYGGNRYTLVIVDDYSSKACIILNKHTRKVKEPLNVTFDETPPPSKTSPLVDDDLDEEEAIKFTVKKNLEKGT